MSEKVLSDATIVREPTQQMVEVDEENLGLEVPLAMLDADLKQRSTGDYETYTAIFPVGVQHEMGCQQCQVLPGTYLCLLQICTRENRVGVTPYLTYHCTLRYLLLGGAFQGRQVELPELLRKRHSALEGQVRMKPQSPSELLDRALRRVPPLFDFLFKCARVSSVTLPNGEVADRRSIGRQ